ncbi:unnamed protein product [Meloidogyne enterolobii]|uniref:Uncharacterized protein n=1 Tax=Meloidogyne enterolobii TaxID=390850 RepID=A0ACB0YIP4_MELEN
MRCNLILGSKFASNLGYKLIKPAKPWVFRSQVGGFRTIYEGGLSFVTSPTKERSRNAIFN